MEENLNSFNKLTPTRVVLHDRSFGHWLVVVSAISSVVGYIVISFYLNLWPFEKEVVYNSFQNTDSSSKKWTTFKNEQMGFSFDYPTDSSLEFSSYALRIAPRGNSIFKSWAEIQVLAKKTGSTLNIEDISKSRCFYGEIRKVESINGLKGIRCVGIFGGDVGGYSHYAFLESEKLYFEMTIKATRDKTLPIDQEEIYNKIFHSFRGFPSTLAMFYEGPMSPPSNLTCTRENISVRDRYFKDDLERLEQERQQFGEEYYQDTKQWIEEEIRAMEESDKSQLHYKLSWLPPKEKDLANIRYCIYDRISGEQNFTFNTRCTVKEEESISLYFEDAEINNIKKGYSNVEIKIQIDEEPSPYFKYDTSNAYATTVCN